ncbi:MAG TPA: hypothetical protein VI669_00640 [Vicinamibacteria bacterium]
MTKRLAHSCALALAVLPAFGEEGRPARVYTNEDLERVAPLRGETGVMSRPGPTSAAKAPAPEATERGTAKQGEAYWRREASRVREKVRTLQEQASRLREQIEREAERAATGKGRRGRLRESWAAEDNRARRLREAEARAREVESEFEDRARREGALPGWLR